VSEPSSTPPPEPFDEKDRTAIEATVKLILDSDTRADEIGLSKIPPAEAIAAPNPKDYLVPDHLRSTAPDLISELEMLLTELRELNARHIGRNTNEVQSYLSLTGEHEPLEQLFYQWTKTYFGRRGNLDRLNPRVKNDPFLLYWQCLEEFDRFLGRLNMLERSLNMSVLGLSVEHVQAELADRMLSADVGKYQNDLPHRFTSKGNAEEAEARVVRFHRGHRNYAEFLATVAHHLPPEFTPRDAPEWEATTRNRIKLRGEELELLRFALSDRDPDASEPRQLAPQIWAKCSWDVFLGGSVLMVMTDDEPDKVRRDSTEHAISFRRDGRLCCRQFPWVQVDPDAIPDEKKDLRQKLLAVNLFVLDTLSNPFYKAWSDLDLELIARRGAAADATEQEQTAALAAVMATASEDVPSVEATPELKALASTESEPSPDQPAPDSVKGRRVGVFRLRKFVYLLHKYFGCEWSRGVGSEVKVRRHGSHYYILGNHGSGQVVLPYKVRDCLDRLNIPLDEFKRVCR
jgi:hypothetical protein